jgi:ferredoxin-NADP reductase
MNTIPGMLHNAIVIGTKAETPDVMTLSLAFEREAQPSFIPGQYVTVYVPELGTPEGKAYSISSAPDDPFIEITVKRMGRFSGHLCGLQKEQTLAVSAPYGFFYSEETATPLSMVAGGIGIIPLMSMIRHSVRHDPKRSLSLWYSNRTTQDIVFRDELAELERSTPALSVHHHVTREDVAEISGLRGGRFSPADITAAAVAHPTTEFMLCGSISFVRDIWKGLRAKGIPERQLYTESFY